MITPVPQHKHFRKSIANHGLFSQMTRKNKKFDQKQQKMICTKDTQKSEVVSMFKVDEFDLHFQNEVRQFKASKASQIAQIAVEGGICVKSIIKRTRERLQRQLFQFVQKTMRQMDINQQKSVQKKQRSPKQLGSTIEHTFTPKSIQTPAFDFESSGQSRQINEFSVRSNQFTLGNQKQVEIQKQNKKDRTVSQFSVASRNPTSRRIKDRIMNSKRNCNY